MINFYETQPGYESELIDETLFEKGNWLEGFAISGNDEYKSFKSEAFKEAEKLIDANGIEGLTMLHEVDLGCIEEVMCELMETITGRRFKYKRINGCVQGEWQMLYYPSGADKELLDWIEDAYWNKGSEWYIKDGKDVITFYSFETDEDKLKEDLAWQCGALVDECRFYKFDGYRVKYKRF